MKITNLVLAVVMVLNVDVAFAGKGPPDENPNLITDAELATPIKVDTSLVANTPLNADKSLVENLPNFRAGMISDVGAGIQGAIDTAVKSCEASSKSAKVSCLTTLNPKIQAASGMIGLLLSGVGAMASTAESCGKYNKALKIAETALTTYNGMCSAGQISCESSCSKTESEITYALGKLTEMKSLYAGQANVYAQQQLVRIESDIRYMKDLQKPIGDKIRVCEGYKVNLAAASVGLMNVVKQSALSESCQAKTTAVDCAKDPANPSCQQNAQLDCSKAENSANTQCICMASPNTAGCAGFTGQNSFAIGGGSSSAGESVGSPNAEMPSFGGTDSGSPTAMGVRGSEGGAPGGSVGGGGGGIPGGGNASNKAADGKKESGISANILSGYEGGGGGGGGRGGSNYNLDSAYKAYMPGGAKDPSRGIASKTFGNGEVTGAGSKSNWEKVSERYLDNKPTLMGP